MEKSSLVKTLQSLDQFRVVSRDLTQGTFSGGAFTAVAYASLLILLVAELGAFLRTSHQTNVIMDQNSDSLVQLNFDFTMFDLPCKYLKIAVFDKFGEERMGVTNEFHYIPIDHAGRQNGASSLSSMAYSKDEVEVLEEIDALAVSDEEQKELDADWSSTDDHFKHHSLSAAVTFHDFTLVNFFAEWCIHCRNFHPKWEEAAAKVSEQMRFAAAEGGEVTVKFMKVNCVAFGPVCQEAKVPAFPTVRLYKRDGTFSIFQGQRTTDGIVDFLTSSVRDSHIRVAHHHDMFSQGCQVQGSLQVPRVPGHFHLQAEAHGDQSVNPVLTNVSHKVNHLSFGEKDAKSWASWQRVPETFVSHLSPLDGKVFAVGHFHEAPQHYLKVVSTHVQGQDRILYQMTHSDRVRRLPKDTQKAPQARFSYDFSPMSVVVKENSKRWYEFLTSLFAILGGTYTIVELTSGAVESVSSKVKEALGKKN